MHFCIELLSELQPILIIHCSSPDPLASSPNYPRELVIVFCDRVISVALVLLEIVHVLPRILLITSTIQLSAQLKALPHVIISTHIRLRSHARFHLLRASLRL